MLNKRGKINKTCIKQASVDDSNHQSTQPESLVVSNDDLLTEILIRLPVTSILRFKSVSKHWRLLLTHTHFTHRFDNNISKSHGLFFCGYFSILYVLFDVENRSTPPFRSLDIYINRPHVKIVQSCNGLLLCSTDRGPQGGSATLKYYVFNPTTKQLAIIPPLIGGYGASKTICLAALAFHQNQTDCVHYKVVCIRSLEPRGKSFQIQIYSSETRKWKICTESFTACKLSNPVYWNGSVYWAPLHLNRNHLCFKADAERLQTLPLPEGLTASEIVTKYLGESRGHLHFIAYENREGSGLHFNVFEMLSDQSGWFVKYQVELDELLGDFPEMMSPSGRYYFCVVDVVRGKQEEDTFLVLKIYERVITYNVYDKSFKQIFSLPNNCIYGESVHRYTETLTSFKKTSRMF